MKILILLSSIFLVQVFASNPPVYYVYHKVCVKAGIYDQFLPKPDPFPAPTTDLSVSGGIYCPYNKCCTSKYLARLGWFGKAIFRKCITGTFDRVIRVAKDFFDDFDNFFERLFKRAFYSSYASATGIKKCKNRYYIDNNILFLSDSLANSTHQLLKGEIKLDEFKDSLQNYSCGFLASVVQKTYFKRSLHLGRISGDCLCSLKIPRTRITVGKLVSRVIAARVRALFRILKNIFKLIRAIADIRDDSLSNLVEARNFKPSRLCIRLFAQTLGCQSCSGIGNRTCPDSCRKVTQFCLEPLRRGFSQPYDEFIRIIRLVLNALTGKKGIYFHFHGIHRVVFQLTSGIRRLGKVAKLAFLAASVKGQRFEDHKCFYSKQYDIDYKIFKCKDTYSKDDDILTPQCIRIDDGYDVPKVKTFKISSSGQSSDQDSDTDSGTDTDTDNDDADMDNDTGTDTDSDSDTESGSDSDSDSKSGSKSGRDSGSDSDSDSKSGTDSGSDSGSDSDSGTESEEETEPEKAVARATVSYDDDDDGFTEAEKRLRKVLLKFILRFRRFSSFRLIFNRINRCVCRPTPYRCYSNATYCDRPLPLYIGRPPYCLNKFPYAVKKDDFKYNPIYLSLTKSEKEEFTYFVSQTESKYKDIKKIISNDPEVAKVLSQIADDEASKGSAFFVNLFALLASLIVGLLLLI